MANQSNTAMQAEGIRVLDVQGRLEHAIDRALDASEKDNREILTRPQQRLQFEEERHAEITIDKKRRLEIIRRATRNMERLRRVLEIETRTVADLETEDASVLDSIHKLRTLGVSL